MSAKKIEGIKGTAVVSQTSQVGLTLSATSVRLHGNGIEFHTSEPMTVWKEIAIALESPFAMEKIQCTGVVVACKGNRHTGYNISMLFTQISRHSQELLGFLSTSRLN
jgi:hypothetical protein